MEREGTEEQWPEISLFDACAGREPKKPPPLDGNEVHLWNVKLNPGGCFPGIETLSQQERRKADRFHFARHRRRFIIIHAALRRILAAYLECDPGDIEFAHGPHGKPAICSGPHTLAFSISKSHDLGIIAVAHNRRLGVDVEYIRAMTDMDGLVADFFSSRERSLFAKLGEDEKVEVFFNCWTRKEAYLKALGKGLTQPLDSFAVAFQSGAPARLLWVRDDPQEVRRWWLYSFSPQAGYAGAVAIQKKGSGESLT